MSRENDDIFMVANTNENLYVANLVYEKNGTCSVAYDPIVAFACRKYQLIDKDEFFFGSTPITVGSVTAEDDPIMICNLVTKKWWVAEDASGDDYDSMLDYLLEVNKLKK